MDAEWPRYPKGSCENVGSEPMTPLYGLSAIRRPTSPKSVACDEHTSCGRGLCLSCTYDIQLNSKIRGVSHYNTEVANA